MKFFLYIFIISTYTISCSSLNFTNSKQDVIDNFIENGWDFQIPKSIGMLNDKFGKPLLPLKIKKSTYNEKLKRLAGSYSKISFSWLIFPDQDYKISNLIVSSPSYKLKYGLKVGSSVSDLIKVLGEPSLKSKNSLIYSSSNFPAKLIVYLKNKKITRLSFHPIGKTMKGYVLYSN